MRHPGLNVIGIMKRCGCSFLAVAIAVCATQAAVEGSVEAQDVRHVTPLTISAYIFPPRVPTHERSDCARLASTRPFLRRRSPPPPPSHPTCGSPRAPLLLAAHDGPPARSAPRPPGRSPAFAAMASFRGGWFGIGAKRPKRILLDDVEDLVEAAWRYAKAVVIPAFHLLRLGFGLSLVFYGMAFRTFAFHVIVFRIAGMGQVRRAFVKLCDKYQKARESIKEATDAAGSIKELNCEDSLKEVRKRMIEEKHRLMEDGKLTDAETAYFMNKYRKDLQRIMDEQEQFRCARSSIFSMRRSINPKAARDGVGGLYNVLVTGFTASTIPAAGRITLSLHVANLLKTHILDTFGGILDPIGHRLDLNAYFEGEEIPYMGRANTMGWRSNLVLNLLCYGIVLLFFRIHPSVALKVSMVYYGGRVVTDYVVMALEPIRKRLGMMAIDHTPTSALVHATITALGFMYHRGKLSGGGMFSSKIDPLVLGPGIIGLLEPYVKLAVRVSKALQDVEATRVDFVEDPLEAVKEIAEKIVD